jgi:hypothetical protein
MTVFPQQWVRWKDEAMADRRNSIVNIVTITQYTNGWKSNRAPKDYVKQILSLGVSEERLRAIFNDHLVDLDDLRENDWASFYAKRRDQIHNLLVKHFTSDHV